jgi:hypothetical protein
MKKQGVKIVIAFVLACIFCLVLGPAALAQGPPESITINEDGPGDVEIGDPDGVVPVGWITIFRSGIIFPFKEFTPRLIIVFP